jgi:cytochrome c553
MNVRTWATVLALVPTLAMAGPAPIKDVMSKIVEPASNAVFYIGRQAPKNDDEWKALQGQALMLSEVATSLMTPTRAKDKKQWMQDAKLLIDAGNAAYAAANAKNAVALEELNDQLYTACTTCHEHYLPKR